MQHDYLAYESASKDVCVGLLGDRGSGRVSSGYLSVSAGGA